MVINEKRIHLVFIISVLLKGSHNPGLSARPHSAPTHCLAAPEARRDSILLSTTSGPHLCHETAHPTLFLASRA